MIEEVMLVDDQFEADEFGLDEQGRLILFGADEAAVGEPPRSPWDAEVDAGWDPSDHLDAWEDDGNGPEAWLRSLPPELRAEVEARPSVTCVPWEAGPAVAAASFADGGLGDGMLPGAMLGQLLAEATVEGYAELSDDELAGVLRAWQRQAASCQGELAVAVRCLEGRRGAGSSRAAEHVADELAVELTLTGRSAARQLELSAGLERLEEVRAALLSGFIDWARACVFVDELAVVDDAVAAGIAGRLAGKAAGWTTGQLRAALARAVLAADPAAAERRKKHASKDTRVELGREGSGNAALAGRELRPASAIVLDRKLSSDADWLSACGVPGSRDELRVLAYTTLLSGRELESVLDDPASWPAGSGQSADADMLGESAAPGEDKVDEPAMRGGGGPRRGDGGPLGGDSGPLGGDGGPLHGGGAQPGDGRGGADRPAAASEPAAGSVHLTMPASAFLGGGEPGEVPGYGPVDAPASRELAAFLARDPATRWCLTLTGADGRPLAHACARRGPAPGQPVLAWAGGLRERLLVLESGTCRHARESAGYVPPPRLRHLVRVRQRRCAFPGCRRPARQCDLDHTIPYDQGGRTCECNLAPLCRRHHRAKQAPGWQLTQDEPGVMTWRPPSGRSYQTRGDPYLS